MAHSPGHRKWPSHHVVERRQEGKVSATFNGEQIAESASVIRVEEDGHPPRYYFPREDVRMDLLQRTDHTSECPFKGHANYYSVRADGQVSENAVWTYEDPYDEHRALKGRLAFYDDRIRLEVG